MSYPDFNNIFEDDNMLVDISMLEDISILLKITTNHLATERKMLLIAGTPDTNNVGYQWFIINGVEDGKNSVLAKGKSLEPFIKSLRDCIGKMTL